MTRSSEALIDLDALRFNAALLRERHGGRQLPVPKATATASDLSGQVTGRWCTCANCSGQRKRPKSLIDLGLPNFGELRQTLRWAGVYQTRMAGPVQIETGLLRRQICPHLCPHGACQS